MKILLADDDKIERTALCELIGAQPNLEIFQVEDGQAALDALCDGLKPDLCIFDIRMPKINGIELLQRMRRDPLLRSLKVVMTSATRDRDTILVLAKLQLTGYLLKPYDPVKSRAVLQPLLATAGANPQLASRNLLAKTVLVVDDDDLTRVSLESMIRTEPGWEVITSKHGQDALTRLHAGLRPDLIIVDLVMPVLDGITFVTRVREDPQLRSQKIAVISGMQDRDKIVALAALGVRNYFSKPFEQGKITALLRNYSSAEEPPAEAPAAIPAAVVAAATVPAAAPAAAPAPAAAVPAETAAAANSPEAAPASATTPVAT
jgi:CheY-like chemotaxis protein